ncbi:MAG: 7-carboxy-7-deazaguanine synthase [Candidatus Methanofastidiosum methylothiophilum]|uniref:7-carboxy-7-deazaguanine synthase n=1 Tax=Candidatus Methanofastidiosum methylothiophilum TaxID=1705564 RepID=A0A150JB02_9EURY|nr:MAG: 7-carboxy-7-deazaguanine synthase [Candidatus Methanofastidiosum methylthiophilus]NMC76415.1 4Fe-4S cluster-binding domain-containing protein [Candidatus Methanofastidiosa archaeon]
MSIKKTDANSYHTGKISKGCKLCIKGRKSVLFVTGVCNVNCYYCPLSEEKKGRDFSYINERKIEGNQDILEELKACSSKGISLTGGDPLLRINRCLEYSKLIKDNYNSAHIHLYTGTTDKSVLNLKKLEGYVDEVRFHVKNADEIQKLDAFLDMNFIFGIEIPAIPGDFERIKKIIQAAEKTHLSFVNLNEFEYTDTNWDNLCERGFEFDSDTSMIKGSKELSLELIETFEDSNIPIHFCPSVLKDAIQLRRRWEIRARNTKKYYEEIEDCLIVKGVLEGDTEEIVEYLINKINISKRMYEIEDDKVYTHWAIAEEISEDTNFSRKIKIGIIKEYPIYKRLVAEYIPL